MEHVLVKTQATLEMIFSAGYADEDNDVRVQVVDVNGNELVGSAVATKDMNVEGRYTYTLDPVAELTLLTVRWFGQWQEIDEEIVDHVEIVGGYLFPIARLRAFKDKGVSVSADYPDTALIRKRAEVTDFFEQVCRTSFIPRYGRSVLDGPGRRSLFLPRQRIQRLLSVSVDGRELSGDELSRVVLLPRGQLMAPHFWRRGWQNVLVEYVYGFSVSPPKIAEAGLALARYELVNRDLSDRTIAMTSDLGTIRLSVPGRDYPTGLPVVDTALGRYDESAPLMA